MYLELNLPIKIIIIVIQMKIDLDILFNYSLNKLRKIKKQSYYNQDQVHLRD